jgi:hypothetical protein
MRIGVVSDTHDNLRNVAEIVARLNGAGVERVVHTGDVTQARTLDALSRLQAPLVGVWGNNDRERESLESAATRHGFRIVDPPLELCWAERRILVVHDPRELAALPLGRFDLVLHGHDHRRRLERQGGTLVFNPGECSGWLLGHNAVGVVDLVRLDTELLHF